MSDMCYRIKVFVIKSKKTQNNDKTLYKSSLWRNNLIFTKKTFTICTQFVLKVGLDL